MATYDDQHTRISAMLRRIVAAISGAFDEDLGELYKGENGEMRDSGKSCWKWHKKLRRYSANPYSMRKYASLIQYCFDNDINLDKFPPWIRMMRIILPEEYNAKIKSLDMTIVQAADMDVTQFEKKKDARDWTDIKW